LIFYADLEADFLISSAFSEALSRTSLAESPKSEALYLISSFILAALFTIFEPTYFATYFTAYALSLIA
jgi:hypothetical protein